jgi:hypothetical protein
MHADTDAGTHLDLIASRARIRVATDKARRHLQRDLHDGIHHHTKTTSPGSQCETVLAASWRYRTAASKEA